MKIQMMSLYFKIQQQLSREEGQDLIEYALLVALIAFGAVAGLHSVANAINNTFGNIASTLTNSIT